MNEFVHIRHKPPTLLDRPRELVVACAPLRSNVNLSRIVRTAGCCGVTRMICCGNARIVARIARDSMTDEERPNGAAQFPSAATDGPRVHVEVHRTLPPVLRELKRDGFELVGLEQTTHSESLFTFRFARRTALVVGNERTGLTADELRLLDRVTEIPVFGLPYSLNVATAASMALYEYCRQFPSG